MNMKARISGRLNRKVIIAKQFLHSFDFSDKSPNTVKKFSPPIYSKRLKPFLNTITHGRGQKRRDKTY